MSAFPQLRLNPALETPLYRQLAEAIQSSISSGEIAAGERLPATRELAGQLGLNRTTVSAAYTRLEEMGLLEGQVGRGSFVAPLRGWDSGSKLDWEAVLPPLEPFACPADKATISFANSRPSEECFPLAGFRRLAKEVIDSPEACDILQLGSPYGYEPLRRYLLERARQAGMAQPGDDLIITNGCQQALDLLARVLVTEETPVILEDPVYHGLLRVFRRAKANILSFPAGQSAVDLPPLDSALSARRPPLLVVTPNFQNPTGATLSLEQRRQILEASRRAHGALIEVDIYSDLRYAGRALPSLKQLDEGGSTILVGSYSKVAFPGLRIGWILAPRPVIERLSEAKQISDLHSDQLSQAVILRFAETGELARHLEETCRLGADRLRAVLAGCEKHLPPGTKFTKPEGGMNLWVELPPPLSAEGLRREVEERGVSFLPGSYFSVRRSHLRALRLSFGGLSPVQITRGLEILGQTARHQLAGQAARQASEPAAALV